MRLDYSSLELAAAQLRRSLDYLHSDMARDDAGLREQFRAATIQAFEYSYELAVRMIRRQLARAAANPAELKQINFADLMRGAADAGIIHDPLPYIHYRELRRNTFRAYNAEHAEQTVAAMGDFMHSVRFLLGELERRNPEGGAGPG